MNTAAESVLIHLSDTHLTRARQPLHGGVDSDAQLARALRALPHAGLDVTAIVVTVTLLAPRARARLGRLADTAEVVTIALLVPLGVIAAGWA